MTVLSFIRQILRLQELNSRGSVRFKVLRQLPNLRICTARSLSFLLGRLPLMPPEPGTPWVAFRGASTPDTELAVEIERAIAGVA